VVERGGGEARGWVRTEMEKGTELLLKIDGWRIHGKRTDEQNADVIYVLTE
jgi:hypothetical protein